MALAKALGLGGVELQERDPDVQADELLKSLPTLIIFHGDQLTGESRLKFDDGSDCLQVLSRPELME